MKTVEVTMPCATCQGQGRVPLTGVHAVTLALLRKRTREVTGAELAASVKCTGPAMNNRLARLQRLGLATSRRWGRQRLYLAVPVKKGASS